MSEVSVERTETIAATLGDAVQNSASSVEDIVRNSLGPAVFDIDQNGHYPEQVLRDLGQAGAFAKHLPGYNGNQFSLRQAIEPMQTAGEKCLSTSFCMWCQDALGWYIFNSENEEVKERLGGGVASGTFLGGTGLSNPMKMFYGIEPLRLRGKKVPGGYQIKGNLPWVSNLGDDHYFGGIFEREDKPGHYVMAVIDCGDDAVTLAENNKFVALDGTRTFSVQIRDLFIPEALVLGDPVEGYLSKIRAGFVLLQAGMAFGVIKSSIDLMKRMEGPLGHVNKYLDEQPAAFEEQLSAMQDEVWRLCETPHETDSDYWRDVIKARLAAGEATVKAAHAAMLHCGARGYVINGEAQRRLREAYFVAIVTPATKQLRKMLAEMTH